MEGLDLMDDPLRELEHLKKLAADPTKRFDKLYRLVGHLKQRVHRTSSYWRAGCSEELPAQFCGRWAETHFSNGATRRPSTHSALCTGPVVRAALPPPVFGRS